LLGQTFITSTAGDESMPATRLTPKLIRFPKERLLAWLWASRTQAIDRVSSSPPVKSAG